MNTMVNATTTATLSEGYELVTKLMKERTTTTPPYQCLGRYGRTHFKDENGKTIYINGMDVMPILKDLSAPATWLFWTLAELRELNSNVCHLRAAVLSSCELNRLKKGYKELKEVQLIIRIKQEYYLINPKVFVPKFEHYESVQKRWDSLT